MIYTAIFIFACVTIFTVPGKQKNLLIQKSFSELILGTTLISILVFAFLVGINTERADYINYLLGFQKALLFGDDNFFQWAKSQHAERGYNYLQAFIKTLGGTATLFFIIFCFLSLWFRYLFTSFFVSKKDLGIVFFAFFAHEFLRKDCVQIRNGFASAIVLYSFIALYKGQKVRFLITVLLASLFHSVAIVALPLVFVRKKSSKKYEKFLCSFFVIVFILSIFLHIRTILSLLGTMNLLPPQIITYLNWSTYLQSMSFTNPLLVKQYVLICWILFKGRKFFSERKIFFLTQIYLLSTAYYLIFRDFEILAGRFGSLFYAVEAPLLVLIIEKTKTNLFLKKLFVCFFYFALFLLNYFTYQNFLGWKPEFN